MCFDEVVSGPGLSFSSQALTRAAHGMEHLIQLAGLRLSLQIKVIFLMGGRLTHSVDRELAGEYQGI